MALVRDHWVCLGDTGPELVERPRRQAKTLDGDRLVLPAPAMAFDLALVAAMFLAQWYWTVFAWALSRGCDAVAQARQPRKR